MFKKIVLIGYVLGLFFVTPTLQAATQEQNIESFVKRLYLKVLNRNADAGGLHYWKQALLMGKMGGGRYCKRFHLLSRVYQ